MHKHRSKYNPQDESVEEQFQGPKFAKRKLTAAEQMVLQSALNEITEFGSESPIPIPFLIAGMRGYVELFEKYHTIVIDDEKESFQWLESILEGEYLMPAEENG